MGTPPYSRPTLVAVVFYAMYSGHYEYENIVRFAGDSIGAQWILNSMRMPSYKTVERTINEILSELDSIFVQVLHHCDQQGLIGGCRFVKCGLELNLEKTKIVYCKDDDRKGDYENTSFDFLGYTFRPRHTKNVSCYHTN